jgi:hypothetical protein
VVEVVEVAEVVDVVEAADEVEVEEGESVAVDAPHASEEKHTAARIEDERRIMAPPL